jgi:hypothetical protein
LLCVWTTRHDYCSHSYQQIPRSGVSNSPKKMNLRGINFYANSMISSPPNTIHTASDCDKSSLDVFCRSLFCRLKLQTIQRRNRNCYCEICEEFHEANALTSTSWFGKAFTHTLTQFHQLFGQDILCCFSLKVEFFEWLILGIGHLLCLNTSAPRWDTPLLCSERRLYSFSMDSFFAFTCFKTFWFLLELDNFSNFWLHSAQLNFSDFFWYSTIFVFHSAGFLHFWIEFY